MKSLKRILWVGFATAILHGSASAQTIDTSGGGGGGGGGITTGGGGTTTGGGGIGSSGLNTGTAQGNAASQSTAITLSPPSQSQTQNAMNASNNLGRYYANPMFQGRAGTEGSSATAITNPGGFGAALYGTGGGGATGAGGRGGSTATSGAGGTGGFTGSTGTTGRTAGTTGFGATAGAGGIGGTTTGFGGATTGRAGGGALGGAGGLGGLNGGQQQNNGMISPRPIAYTAVYRFPMAVVTPLQQQTELRTLVDTSSQIIAPKNIQVQVEKGGLVVLKGDVADEDEARLVEGMMRITPGVRDVKNELKYPTNQP